MFLHFLLLLIMAHLLDAMTNTTFKSFLQLETKWGNWVKSRLMLLLLLLFLNIYILPTYKKKEKKEKEVYERQNA